MDVVGAVTRLGASNQGLVPVRLLVAEGITRSVVSRAVSAGVLHRVVPGVYSLAPLPARPRFLVTHTGVDPAHVARVRATLLSLGGRAAASGLTAATLFGWGVLEEPTLIDVALPHGRTIRRAGVRGRQRRGPQRSRLRVLRGTDRMLVTSSVQTVLDCAATLPLLEAVVVADSALRSGTVTLDRAGAAAVRLPGQRDVTQVRRVLDLCDVRSGSVLESVLRVRLVLAGIDGFTTQAVLSESPELRVDFCFPAHRLVVEVDGARWHEDPLVDRARDNTLACLGWRVLRFTWRQVVHEPEQTVALIRRALAATDGIHLPAVRPAAAA